MLNIASLNLGPPLVSPKLNGQIRNSIRVQPIRRWVPLLVIVCVSLIFLQYELLGGRSHEQQRAQAQAVQHIYINSASAPYGGETTSITQNPLGQRTGFPPKIWQTWKVDPLRFEERDLENARSWTEKNPDWRYEVLTDGNDMRYVEYHFGPEGFNRPDIVAFYRDVTAAIIKADLLRYLIMYAEGGVYADIDVEAMKPMSKFIPERYDHKDIDMVIGVEIDEPQWRHHPILGPKSTSFCQWTFMCKPQLPVMMHLVENIMAWLQGVAQNQTVPLGEVALDFDEVISGTGPSAFTRAIIAQMNEDRLRAAAAREDGAGSTKAPPEVTWDVFHDLDESKVVDRVLVLNVEAFAAGQGHSNSGTHDTRHSLVRHHYHASNWPSRHPRYRHPAFGQVEDCNWNKECVDQWDADVAAFEKLSDVEQKHIIAEKAREVAEAEAAEAKAREEEEAQAKKEEEERIKADEERARKEAEEKLAANEGDVVAPGEEVPPEPPVAPGLDPKMKETGGGLPPPGRPAPPASFANNVLGYTVFVCAILFILRANGCLTRRSGPHLPTTEQKK